MNYRWIVCLLATTCMPLFADTIDLDRNEDQEIQALREWLNLSRQVTLKEIGGNLSISGEVRTEFQTKRELVNGKRQRGRIERRLGGARNGYDIEVNLMFDYRTDRTWSSIKLEFDNDMGVFGSTADRIALEKAYWGARLIADDEATLDVEIGRRAMTAIFDSKIEFGSTFDGVLFDYKHAFKSVGDLRFGIGALLVYERRDQFAYVAEIGLLDIGRTGIYIKYSLIDWDTKHYKRKFIDHRFEFLISQLILGYRFKVNCLEQFTILYLAGLRNHLAKRLELTHHQHANWGGYVGLSIGQLRKQWDWAFDINYQVVAAQAIPDFDYSGIGLGNSNKSGFYTKKIRPIDGDGPSTRKTAGGTTNYRGFSITFDILLTDKINWQQSYMQSITLDNRIGPFRRYLQYEMEFIYSW